MLADITEQVCTEITAGSPDVFFRISLSVLLNPADPWLPPFSVIPFEGPVGDSSHLEEVLNHNIFSGSSWECVVIKERG